MKRIKLHAYLCNNLGDDLMVDILLKKYPQYAFYCSQYIPLNCSIRCNSNFVDRELLYRRYGRVNHLLNIITLKKIGTSFFDKVFKRFEDSCKCSVYIGGSLFMQNPLEDTQNRIEYESKRIEALPMHIIGANFGPYYNEEFLDGFKKCFKKCVSITFRDKYSFNLFSENENVSYAADVVFNLDTSLYTHLPETNNAIISVIDFEKRDNLKEYMVSYENHIKECCINLINKGYTPVLMSFCKAEGDEDAIDRIYEQMPDEFKRDVKKYFYHGNINEALEYISRSKYIVATRFHAMILAIRFNKPFYCVAYNQKVVNVLNDLGSDAYILPDTLVQANSNELIDKYAKPIEAEEYMNRAQKQFFSFEQYLKNNL